MAIADRVAAAFAEPYEIDGAEHFVTASLGIAVARPTSREPADPDMLIRDADAAMYRAKEQRPRPLRALRRRDAGPRAAPARDRARAARTGSSATSSPSTTSRSSRSTTGEITGLEALVRWDHPTRGLLDPPRVHPGRRGERPDRADRPLGPGERLPPDPRAGTSSAPTSGRSTSRSTSRPARSPTATSPTRSPRCSPAPGSTPSTCAWRSPRASWSRSRPAPRRPSRRSASSACGLVLDDFGTGYSSLAYLNRFPLDALKIDRSFVDALGIEQERTAIVEAIIGMARALSLDVIAEGVENEAQLSELRRLGCDYAQGHLFSRALPAERITDCSARAVARYSGILPGR